MGIGGIMLQLGKSYKSNHDGLWKVIHDYSMFVVCETAYTHKGCYKAFWKDTGLSVYMPMSGFPEKLVSEYIESDYRWFGVYPSYLRSGKLIYSLLPFDPKKGHKTEDEALRSHKANVKQYQVVRLNINSL